MNLKWIEGKYYVVCSQSHGRSVQFPPNVEVGKDQFGNDEVFMTPEEFKAFLLYNSLVIYTTNTRLTKKDEHCIVRGNETEGGTMYGQVWYTETESKEYNEIMWRAL